MENAMSEPETRQRVVCAQRLFYRADMSVLYKAKGNAEWQSLVAGCSALVDRV